MIDTHCHIDQYPDPEELADACERAQVTTIAVTSLPSHYEMAADHLVGYKFIHAALGFHPLLAAKNSRQLSAFERLAPNCRFIGEIGIDGSRHGRSTIELQAIAFDRIVAAISSRKRFVTLHSKGAVDEVLKCLGCHSMYPVVFHWFSGNGAQLAEILDAGHYLSFNPAMAESPKWQTQIGNVPLDRILTETDGPYCKISGRAATPADVHKVTNWIAARRSKSAAEISEAIRNNFAALSSV